MFTMNRRRLFLSSAKGALAAALGAVGFRTAARAQSPTAVQLPDSTVLPTPTPPFKGFIEPNRLLEPRRPALPPPERCERSAEENFAGSAFGGIVCTGDHPSGQFDGDRQ